MKITKDTPIKEVEEMLDSHCISTPYGWEIVIGMLLSECDFITIEGFGHNAQFMLHS